MFTSCSDCVALFSSASGPALSQEAADGKINVQSACSLNTVYVSIHQGFHILLMGSHVFSGGFI
jgi:hypothetical protein